MVFLRLSKAQQPLTPSFVTKNGSRVEIPKSVDGGRRLGEKLCVIVDSSGDTGGLCARAQQEIYMKLRIGCKSMKLEH